MSVTIRIGTYIVYTFIPNVGTHQEPMRKLRLPVSASAAGPFKILAVPFHRNYGPSTEARPARVSPAPVLSTQLPRHQAANTAQPTMPWQWRSMDLFWGRNPLVALNIVPTLTIGWIQVDRQHL